MTPDDAEFATWWTEHRESLFRAALKWTSDIQAADDIVQTLGIMCWKNPSSWPRSEATIHRLRGLTRWRSLDWYRKEKRRKAREVNWWVHRTREAQSIDAPDFDRDTAVAVAIARLPDQQRAVLERDLAGNSSDEIAKGLGIKPSTVRSLRRHAILGLRDLLADL